MMLETWNERRKVANFNLYKKSSNDIREFPNLNELWRNKAHLMKMFQMATMGRKGLKYLTDSNIFLLIVAFFTKTEL